MLIWLNSEFWELGILEIFISSSGYWCIWIMVELGVIRAQTNSHICNFCFCFFFGIFKLYGLVSYNYVNGIADDV